MRTRTPTETLQVVRYENLIPGARLSSPLSPNIDWDMDFDVPSAAALQPYDDRTIDLSASHLERMRGLLAQEGSVVADKVATTETILLPVWRQEQLQFVAFCIERLGRIACRLVEVGKLTKDEGENPKLYSTMTSAALCFAALLGLSGHKTSERTTTFPLYYPVGRVVETMQRYPSIPQNEWRSLYVYTARDDSLRQEIIQRHLDTGLSVTRCYEQIRQEKSETRKF